MPPFLKKWICRPFYAFFHDKYPIRKMQSYVLQSNRCLGGGTPVSAVR